MYLGITPYAAFFAFSLVRSTSAIDRSAPCFNGACSFDIPASHSSMAGILKISGHPHSISDLTEAAGWAILDCNPKATTQNIRAVCLGDDCDHLFHGGAEDTIVRLPLNCGKSPFARVSKCVPSNDQGIPVHLTNKVKRPDETIPKVHTMMLDTDFHKVDVSRAGPIKFTITGSSDPHSLLALGLESLLVGKRELVNHASELRAFKHLFTRQSLNASATASVTVNSTFNVFNQSVPCSDGDDEISVDVLATAEASVSLAFMLVGTVTPPAVTGGAFFSNMTADLGGTITLGTNVVGQFDTGRIGPLVQIPIPDLAIGVPELFSVGVTFNVFAEAELDFDIETQLGLGIAYHVGDLQLIFPPLNGSQSSATITPGNGDLQLSVSPGVASNAKATVHLIPSLNIGLTTAAEQEVSASIFLDLDTSSTLNLTLEAGSTTDISNGGTTTSVIGCVELDGAMSINAGAEGAFFSLFNDSTQVPVASTDLQLFQKCFTKSSSGSQSNPGETSSAVSTKARPNSSFTLIFQTIAIVLVTMMIAGVGAVPTNNIDKRLEIEKASNATSNSTFACVSSNIKPVTSLVNQVLNATSFKHNKEA